MKDVCLFITITQRIYTDEFLRFFGHHGANLVYSTPCAGTVRSKTLDLLGIEQTEKSMIFSVMTGEQMRGIIHDLTTEMQIDLPDRGIGIGVPLTSMGGKSAMRQLLGEEPKLLEREETEGMNNYELIVAIIEKGYTDEVMEAARAAGAGGGTVIRAKGTGKGEEATFLGVSLAEEKEMIFIVTHVNKKKDIMEAVMRDAGIESKAHTILFSMPVTATAGFRLFDADPSKENPLPKQ